MGGSRAGPTGDPKPARWLELRSHGSPEPPQSRPIGQVNTVVAGRRGSLRGRVLGELDADVARRRVLRGLEVVQAEADLPQQPVPHVLQLAEHLCHGLQFNVWSNPLEGCIPTEAET